jgi:Arc/MetJ-type ribon-helix-helix transcriptional regulator
MPLAAYTFRMSDELRELVRRQARELGISDSEFIREAIGFWLGYHAGLRAGDADDALADAHAALAAALGRP